MKGLWFCTQSEFEEARRRRMNKVLYAKAKEYANTNTKGSKLELKCLAEMLYEFTDSQIADLQKKYELLGERCNQLLKDQGDLIDKVKSLEEYKNGNFVQTVNQIIEGKDKRLEQAKEHIRTLISCLIDWVQEGDKDYCHIAEAEQFLNSEKVIPCSYISCRNCDREDCEQKLK